jgi:hypothetical protein
MVQPYEVAVTITMDKFVDGEVMDFGFCESSENESVRFGGRYCIAQLLTLK